MDDLKSDIRVSNHPFTLIGYWTGHAKTSEPQEHAIYQSANLMGLYAIVRLADQQTKFLVRGQYYGTLKSARAVA